MNKKNGIFHTMKLLCCKKSLAEITNLKFKDIYETMVRPLTYEFYITIGNSYNVMGLEMRRGTMWAYVILPSHNKEGWEINIIPVALFNVDWQRIPQNWSIRIIDGEINLLPESLSKIDNWFEKYIDDDDKIISLIDKEIKKWIFNDGTVESIGKSNT
jgi:hypothetical protein